MQSSKPMLAGLPWDEVRLFLALCRSRTMGDAARELTIDPSTVSRRLSSLEDALDTVLFSRGREGLSPTKAAEDLLPTAELVEQGIAQFTTAVDGIEREVSGLVRLTCPPDMAEVVVLPVVRELLAVHDRLRIALEPTEATLDLSRREADLALRVRRPTRSDLIVKRVLTVEWRPAASPELAARLNPAHDPSSLTWVGWNEDQTTTPASRWLKDQVGVEPALTSSSLTAQVAAVHAGIGVALLPLPTLKHHGLVPVDLQPPTTGWPSDRLYLMTHSALARVPRIRAVWDALVDQLATLADA